MIYLLITYYHLLHYIFRKGILMNNNTFKSMIDSMLNDKFDGTIESVITSVIKNNIEEDQISFNDGKDGMYPSIPIRDLMSVYNTKDSIDDVLTYISNALDQAKTIKVPKINTEEFKKSAVLEVVSAKTNVNLLNTAPYYLLPKTDLACVIRWVIDKDKSILVTHALLNEISLSQEDALKIAYTNTDSKPMRFMTMEGFFDSIGVDLSLEEESQLYILQNDMPIFGASVIARNDCLKKVRTILRSNFYIIPSSVHEVLIYSDKNDLNTDEMIEIIKNINLTIVDPIDKLSDSLYYYDGELRCYE